MEVTQNYEMAGNTTDVIPTLMSDTPFLYVHPEIRTKPKKLYTTDISAKWSSAMVQPGVRPIFTEDIPLGNLRPLKASASYLVKEGFSIPNHNLQSIYETTDFQLRFTRPGLDYYKRRIPSEQFRLLMDFLGYSAPGNFDPEEFFYPEGL